MAADFADADAAIGYITLESRPQRVVAARYDALPFPPLAAMQELAFDLGITAVGGDAQLTGIVFRAYHEHQLLFEQRWNHAILLAHTGESALAIAQGTGLALRSLHFLCHGHLPIHFVDVVVVARKLAGGDAGESVQARLQIPVTYHAQQTELHFPLRGTWWAVQTGDWSDLHKQEVFSQPYAVDFVKLGAESRFFSGSGARLEDHYAWGEPVYAAAGGKVAHLTYDMPDMAPGTMPDPRIFRGDPRRILGNAVAISHANGEFTYYAHLQQASLEVNEGQLVRRGALLGRVGNSGESPGPHLHLALLEGPNLFIDRGLPMKLTHFETGGQTFTNPTYLPARMIVRDAAD